MAEAKLSEEQIQEAILKRRACNKKALEIVESLLEANITEEYFLSTLHSIDQSHYQDIVDERSILKICGYPLCANILTNVPAQLYTISHRLNKVYDITELKKFCCGTCFKASEYIKAQILTSPLWLRENEAVPNYTFYKQELSKQNKQDKEISIID